MISNKTSKRKAFIVLFISFLLVFLIYLVVRDKPKEKTILLYKDTPLSLKESLRENFPDYQMKELEDFHLINLVQGAEKSLFYDIEALSLMESGKEGFFYPLYSDLIAIGIRKDENQKKIEGWEDLKNTKLPIAMPDDSPELRYIWANISLAYDEEINQRKTVDYLAHINKKNPIHWDGKDTAIQVNLASKIDPAYEIIIPKEGSLSFQMGLLSQTQIKEDLIINLKESISKDKSLFTNQIDGKDHKIIPVSSLQKEMQEMENILSSLRRKIKGERKYAPTDLKEHHLLSLALIVFILMLKEYSQGRIIHKGIREGLLVIEYLLIGWIGLNVVKYALHGYSVYSHYAWYIFYLFYLPIPAILFYIAHNLDKIEENHTPRIVKINGILAAIFIILVLSNDLHQFIFTFTSTDYSHMDNNYGYGIGFILLTLWFVLTSLGAIILMFKKGIDSPKKKMVVLPTLVLVLGVLYSVSYNLKIPLARDFPMTLALASIITIFIIACIYSGLIPSNRSYNEIFANSQLYMGIYDLDNQLVYKTGIGDKDDKSNLYMEGNSNLLLKESSITGGRVVTLEDIGEINKLRRKLERSIEALERENKILAEKEEVESKLYILNEQNKLALEVHKSIENKLGEIEKLVDKIEKEDGNTSRIIRKVQIIALYCKRRSELLIKSKTQEAYPSMELCRIIKELSSLREKETLAFCSMDINMAMKDTIKLYTYAFKIIEAAEESNLENMTIRINKGDSGYQINLTIEGKNHRFEEKIGKLSENTHDIDYKIKELGDAQSIILDFKGGEDLVGAL